MGKEYTVTLVKCTPVQIEPTPLSTVNNPKILNITASGAANAGGDVTVTNSSKSAQTGPIGQTPATLDKAFSVDVSQPTTLHYDGETLPVGAEVTITYSYD